MASVPVNEKSLDEVMSNVKNVLRTLEYASPYGPVNELKKKLHDGAHDRAYTPEQWAKLDAVLADEATARAIDFASTAQYAPAHTEFTALIGLEKGHTIPHNTYRYPITLKPSDPLYLDLAWACFFTQVTEDMKRYVEGRVREFVRDRSTWGAVQRDWPELIVYMSRKRSAKLRNTGANRKPEITTYEEDFIPVVNTILAKAQLTSAIRPMGKKFLM